jgi:membrane protein DedA with SNARE-associated domain
MLDSLRLAAETLVGFVHGHQAWAVPIAFVFAFVKSLAFVSLFLPTTITVLVLGGLVGAAGLPFVPIWLAISIGAALGDWVSFAIGWRVKDRAHRLWPFSRHPEMLPKAERFFRRWGVLSVALCRFFSPLRATVPLLCGVFEMPSLHFQLANWLSAPAWAFIVLAPGSLLAAWLT